MTTILTKRETWSRSRKLHATRSPDLTPEEKANIQKALRVLRIRFGGWATLAKVMGVNEGTLTLSVVRSRTPSVAMALRAARAADAPMEDILSGAWPKAGACPMCGRGDVAGETS